MISKPGIPSFYIFISFIVMYVSSIGCSCKFFVPAVSEQTEPSYSLHIIWESDTIIRGYITNIAISGNSIYLCEHVSADNSNPYERLIKINAETGECEWRGEEVSITALARPAVTDRYVFILINKNTIKCYDKDTGALAAVINCDAENKGYEIEWNMVSDNRYLYFGYGIVPNENYFVRLEIARINTNLPDPSVPQLLKPEIIWHSQPPRPVWAQPVIADNIIYIMTFFKGGNTDIAGIDIETGSEVWHKEIDYDNGLERYPFVTANGILYVLGYSISAHDLKTGKQIFLKTFSESNKKTDVYYAAPYCRGAIYHEGKIYYTNSASGEQASDSYHNIICIDAQTGRLVWSDIAPVSESLGTNPIIYANKLYVPHGFGMRVYDIPSKKLIGVDSSFCGEASGYNVLYKDILITAKYDRDTGIGKLVGIRAL